MSMSFLDFFLMFTGVYCSVIWFEFLKFQRHSRIIIIGTRSCRIRKFQSAIQLFKTVLLPVRLPSSAMPCMRLPPVFGGKSHPTGGDAMIPGKSFREPKWIRQSSTCPLPDSADWMFQVHSTNTSAPEASKASFGTSEFLLSS